MTGNREILTQGLRAAENLIKSASRNAAITKRATCVWECRGDWQTVITHTLGGMSLRGCPAARRCLQRPPHLTRYTAPRSAHLLHQ